MKRLLSVLSKAVIPCVAVASVAAAAVPNLMPYQGRLTDAAGNPINGSQTIEFSIYDAAEAGSLLHTQTEDVTVQNGLFNVNLGPLPGSLFTGQNLYLGIRVGGDAEMTPRQLLGSVPYAFRVGISPITITELTYRGADSAPVNSGGYILLRTVGNFTKNLNTSDIELTWIAHVTTDGGTFCDFQLRIDSNPNLSDTGRTILYAEGGTTTNSPVATQALFHGLAAGPHTVSIWVRGFSNSCITNTGNFEQTVLVREVEQAVGVPGVAATPEANASVRNGFPVAGR